MIFSFSNGMGIDLGSSRTRIYVRGKGVIFDAPSTFVRDIDTDKLLFLGKRVEEVRGRTSLNLEVLSIVNRGTVIDQKYAVKYLRHAIEEVGGIFSFIKQDVLIGVPTEASNVEQRIIVEVCRKSGAKSVSSECNALLAAFGVGIKRDDYRAWMLVDIGAGLTEIGIISFGGLGRAKSVKVGGSDMDEAIARHIKNKYKLNISTDVAEVAKRTIGSANQQADGGSMQINGSDAVTKLPRSITITSQDIADGIQLELKKIIDAIGHIFQETPPEITSDIIERGIVLVGGVAQLQHLAPVIKSAINAPVYVADDPSNAVIRGISKYLDMAQKQK